MEPVAGDVDDHGQLEQEHEGGVEGGQGRQQTHGRASVSQHVQHCSKLAALTKETGSMTINSVQ